MRVFVTGGNGFIGSALVQELVAAGHAAVCLMRPTSRADRLAGLPFERRIGDVRDVTALREGMSGCDATIHLAAPGGWEKDDPDLLADVIEGGTRNVLEAARSLPHHRVVVVSSTAAIAASETPIVFDERAEFHVGDSSLYYAHAKHRAEVLALDAAERGVPVVIVNPSEVYGPGDTALVSASNLIEFVTSKVVLVCRGGTGIVHVNDVARAIAAALDRGRPGQRYILSGENLTVRQLAEVALDLRGRTATIVTVPRHLARFAARLAMQSSAKVPFNPHVIPYATRYWFVDSAKAQRELGVSFRGARPTIADTIQWLEHTGHLPARHGPFTN